MAFFLAVSTPVHATLIVYGTITGVVTSTGGLVSTPASGIYTPVGTAVSGWFSYDFDLLSTPNASGQRSIGATDINASFWIFPSVGEGGGGGGEGLSIFDFVVDANGLPYSGHTMGTPDVIFGSSSVYADFGPSGNAGWSQWTASVTYTITITNNVPDAGATWFLLGLGLASVAVARRCLRQTPV